MAKRKSGKKARTKASPKKARKETSRHESSHAPAHLREVIEALMEAKGRGDLAAGHKASEDLKNIQKHARSGTVRLAAAHAQAVAGYEVMSDSLRMLREIAARLPAPER